VSAALAFGACTGNAPPRAPRRDVAADVDKVALELSALRRLPIQRPVRARAVDTQEFIEQFGAKVSRESPPRHAEDLVAAFRAFRLVSPEGISDSTARDFVDEYVAGFYDLGAQTVFLRTQTASRLKWVGSLMDRIVLAHEIEHALQDQSFDLRRLAALDDDEQRLAASAVFEGDATLVGLAWEAKSRGRSWEEVVGQIAALSAANAASGFATAPSADLTTLKGNIPVLRERASFQYVFGLSFMMQLYRAGGFELLDRTFTALPTTTEQVLHVDKYIAGEQPIAIRYPDVPPGSSVIATGHLGEFQTRVLLAQCLPMTEAVRAATGWGGDSYTVFKSGSREGVLWVTAWDDEDAADLFLREVSLQGSCTKSPDFVLRREGTRVALVRGLDEDTAQSLFPSLLACVGDRPPATPPVGVVNLVDYVPPLRRWMVSGLRYENPYLGISFASPFGQKDRVDRAGSLIGFEHVRPFAFAGLSFGVVGPGPERAQRFARNYAFATARKWGRQRARPIPLGHARRELGIGTADWQEWEVGGTDVHFALGVIAKCDRANIMVAVGWQDASGKDLIEAWIKSMNVTVQTGSACADLLL
jgi:hypothetical protein